MTDTTRAIRAWQEQARRAQRGNAAAFDYQAGDVGYVPKNTGHYVENTGATTLRLVEATVGIPESVLAKVPAEKTPIVPP